VRKTNEDVSIRPQGYRLKEFASPGANRCFVNPTKNRLFPWRKKSGIKKQSRVVQLLGMCVKSGKGIPGNPGPLLALPNGKCPLALPIAMGRASRNAFGRNALLSDLRDLGFDVCGPKADACLKGKGVSKTDRVDGNDVETLKYFEG